MLGSSRAGWGPAALLQHFHVLDALDWSLPKPRAASSLQRSKVWCLQLMCCSGIAVLQGPGFVLQLVCPCHHSGMAWTNATCPYVHVTKGR